MLSGSDAIRLALCVIFGMTAGVSGMRGIWNRPTVREQLLAFMVGNVAMLAGQISLFGTPLTIRSGFSAVFAVSDVVYLVSFFRHGPPPWPKP